MRPNPSSRGLAAALALALALLSTAESASAQIFGGRRRQQQPPTAIRFGVVHPIDGPAIADAVVLIEGTQITAVGPASEIEIPAKATVIDHSSDHCYPGLIDAMSTAYCSNGLANASGTDASTDIGEILDRYDEVSAKLVESGVTTAYVSNRSGTTWRGIGAIVRPAQQGYGTLRNAPTAPVHLRMTAGPGPSHALTRVEQMANIGKEFDTLEDYEKKRREFDEKLATFEEEWQKYIAYHEKKNATSTKGEPKAGAAKPAEGDAAKGDDKPGKTGKTAEKPSVPEKTPPGDERPQRRGRRGANPAATPPTNGKTPAATASTGASKTDADGKDGKAPERPKYPDEPKADPVKETLIEVRDGERLLRIEAQRPEEIRAALELERDISVDGVVLEGAVGAGPFARELAEAGISVVVGGASFDDPKAAGYLDETDHDLLQTLDAAGVPIAISSGGGSVRRARHLPLIAAQAVAHGLDADVAVRALTLTPARMLRIDQRVGSVTVGKLADLLVTSAPLLSSDARIVQVYSAGRPVIDSK